MPRRRWRPVQTRMNVSRRAFVKGGVAAFTVTFAAPEFLSGLLVSRPRGGSRALNQPSRGVSNEGLSARRWKLRATLCDLFLGSTPAHVEPGTDGVIDSLRTFENVRFANVVEERPRQFAFTLRVALPANVRKCTIRQRRRRATRKVNAN